MIKMHKQNDSNKISVISSYHIHTSIYEFIRNEHHTNNDIL